MSSSSLNAVPGQTITATVAAFAGNDVVIDSISIATTGAVTSSASIPVGAAGRFTATRDYAIPSSAGTSVLTITVVARAGSGSARAQTTVAVADSVRPTLDLTLSPQGNLESGDSVSIILESRDAEALGYTAVRTSGSFIIVDSASALNATAVSRTVKFVVPATASLTTPLQITAVSASGSGVLATKVLPAISVVDTARPTISGALSTTHGSGGAAPGDILTLTATGADRRKLAYVGYRFGPPINLSDSVATSQSAYTVTAQLSVAGSWLGSSIYTVFARDSVGNRTETVVGNLTVATRSRRPIASAALPGTVLDATIDSKRKRIYMSLPAMKEVAVLSTTDMTFAAPLSFAATPHGLDITPGGDSLVVALVDSPNIAIVNLSTGATSALAVTSGVGPDFVRIASNDKALVTLTIPALGFGGSLLEVDLASGASRNLKTVTERAPLAAAGDRSRILALDDDACCPEEALVYDASTGTITGDGSTVNFYAPWVSGDFAGDAFMVRSSVFGANVRATTGYDGSLYSGGPSAISGDGKSGYFATASGVAHVRFSDGTLIEQFALGEQPVGMWMSSDGLTLCVAGSSHVFVIDLW